MEAELAIDILAKHLHVEKECIRKRDEKYYELDTYGCYCGREMQGQPQINSCGIYVIMDEKTRKRKAPLIITDFVNNEVIHYSAYREFFDYDGLIDFSFENDEIGSYIALYDCKERLVTFKDVDYYIYKIDTLTFKQRMGGICH